MLERGRTVGGRLGIVLDRQDLALVEHGGWPRRAARLVAREQPGLALDAETLPAALDALLGGAGVARGVAHVIVDDALVRSWRVEPPLNASRRQDCVAAALMRFAMVYDEAPADWLVRAELDARLPFMACAVRKDFVAAIAEVLQRHRLTMAVMEPRFVALWNHWRRRLPANAWLLVSSEAGLQLGVTQAGRLCAQRRLDPSVGEMPAGETPAGETPTAAWLAQAVQREADRFNIAVPACLAVCGTVQPAWLELSSPRCLHLGSVADGFGLFGVSS